MAQGNGLEGLYVVKDNKKLRYGYTTGSCAAAAAKAAAMMLFTGNEVRMADLMTPKGILLHLSIEKISREENAVVCAVQKDGGDDPDATHGMYIYARVSLQSQEGIIIDGGPGVGRVTKPGLEQEVGEAAINRIPRQMIKRELEEVIEEQEYRGGLRAEIFAPEGEERAKKTFNPRLGILGGISILGTSGIVEPMSEAALIASIRLEMEMKRAQGADCLLITPGNYGADFIQQNMELDVENSMKCSNYVGETVDMAVELGFKGILFVAHIGKFIKVAGGIMNTHSRCADARAELMAAAAIRAGAGLDTAKEILDTFTTEEAVGILKRENLLEASMKEIAGRVQSCLQHRCRGAVRTEAILFSNQWGYLGETDGADELTQVFKKRNL